jgi:hypothetical protein
MSDRGSRLFRALLLNAVTLGALISCNAEAGAHMQALTDNRASRLGDTCGSNRNCWCSVLL